MKNLFFIGLLNFVVFNDARYYPAYLWPEKLKQNSKSRYEDEPLPEPVPQENIDNIFPNDVLAQKFQTGTWMRDDEYLNDQHVRNLNPRASCTGCTALEQDDIFLNDETVRQSNPRAWMEQDNVFSNHETKRQFNPRAWMEQDNDFSNDETMYQFNPRAWMEQDNVFSNNETMRQSDPRAWMESNDFSNDERQPFIHNVPDETSPNHDFQKLYDESPLSEQRLTEEDDVFSSDAKKGSSKSTGGSGNSNSKSDSNKGGRTH
ncbi:golgin subfamily A member 6-like protein 22 [Hydra vulgaris]|uniref:golgin subfamily A member 6-like protein 22 n=1 Tax=Hydra vulgaris TaxID=6087 RepID=UPI0002B4697F|nr:golgin subfamily A member 6-like protein 22 [Hydra vulgaris]